MKKLILIACAVMAFAALAAETGDSYLYWMVNDEITVDGYSYVWGSDPLTTKVVAYNSSTWPGAGSVKELSLYGQSENGGPDLTSSLDSVGSDGMNSSYYAGIVSTVQGNGWSYFIELYNDDVLIGRSLVGLDYASEQTMEYISSGSVLKPANMWIVSEFTATPAPEPNSALLMLIGCAALALRRRKQIAA